MQYQLALTTTDSGEKARQIAHTLVEEQLVACVNIIPGVESIYRFEGKVCNENEWLLVMKTTKENTPGLKARLPEIHSYECPELICVDITDGLPAYLQWLDSVVA